MKKYLAVTIDVEPDCTPTWHYSNPLSFEGVSNGIAKIIQPLFELYGMVPTYMINNVVLEHEASVSIFRSLKGRFELGTHLHPEFIEPQKEFSSYAGMKGEANSCFYEPEIEFQKIENITRLFENCFSYRPSSFRAGRYSAGVNTINSLVKLGYKVDTSVSPHILWNDASRELPVDFTRAKEQPYFIQAGTILEEDPNGILLEVPISISLQRRNRIKEFISAMGGLRHPMRKFKPLWLRPYYSSVDEMKWIVDLMGAHYDSSVVVVFNMMFHNVEVLPGLSPYTQTSTEAENFINQLKDFFEYCKTQNIEGVGISELYDVFKK